MKKRILISIGAFLSLYITSCEPLEQHSKERLSRSKAFQSIEDASYWRNGFYSSLRVVSLGESVLYTDFQADILNPTLDFGNRGGNVHTWNIQSDDDEVQKYWKLRYDNLKDINESIAKFPTIPANEQQKKQINRYLGEAYALRAFYHFELLLRFAPAYNQQNKNTPDLGIPIVTSFDLNLLPSRGTLEQTYTQILADISKSEELLTDVVSTKGSIYFTPDAVQLLKARVLLNKQEYEGAVQAAKKVIDTGKYPLVTTANELKTIWHNDGTDETLFQLKASMPDELPNSMNVYTSFNETAKKYRPDFIPSQWVVDLYPENDLRKQIYFKKAEVLVLNHSVNLNIVFKYPGNPQLYTTIPNGTHAPKIFRIAEAYITIAEAAYKLGNEQEAKTYLNKLKEARGLEQVLTSGQELFQEIKSERLREFAFEGTRLYDLKRWGEGFVRKQPQNKDVLITSPADKYTELQVESTNPRFVWPIPAREIILNSNLKQNVGY